jgi:NDP-sugar pyrophosphorylase family protein
MKNIIVQAGGLGSRLHKNTVNKPKCLVPVNGKPIIQYLLEKFPHSNFYIISDYKFDVLKRYVETFYKKFNIRLIKTNQKGTCSGINTCYDLINNQEPVMLIWSDLILDEQLNHTNCDINVFTTNSLECRYSMRDNKIIKVKSTND